jgi:class 3 adenylate cyclase/tetratricopeptide (TPR) repeat protein
MKRDIKSWLETLQLSNYRDAFTANEIVFGDLLELTEHDLITMGLPIGPRRRALKAIAELDSEKVVTAAEHSPPAVSQVAERRQLTVMFCDLVGSTALSQQLDPEDLREVMRRYQDAVAGAVNRYQGHVAQFLGDGVLAYFGWPQAYEDQAERAVRAGLDAVASVQTMRLEVNALRARVGIASGQVVVGDLIGAATTDVQAVSGETPNLAARLQAIAEPGQVVISEATRGLIGTVFDLHELGRHDLKGFADTVPAWGVIGESAVASRFEASHVGALTNLVGRDNELGLLQERWQTAQNGEGQAMLLSGEAGIGKSRLTQALREKLGATPYYYLGYQCSPHRTNSAYHPIIRRLEHAAGFAVGDSDESKLDKLENLLRPTFDDVEKIFPLFAALLSLPGEDRYGALNLTPVQQRDRTATALVNQILTLSRLKPVLFLLEDAHWLDPSTSELIGEILTRTAGAAVFVLITHRPEFVPPWVGNPHQTSMMLSRLNRNQGIEIVREVSDLELTPAMMERIVERAGGIPLYVEELAKAVTESTAAVDGQNFEEQLPESLQASLMARLDWLGDAKRVAQTGAVIGRDFSHALIAELTGMEVEELDEALGKITTAELISCKGAPPEAVYTFKHALIQDAAYQSLLIAQRNETHLRAGATLEGQNAKMGDVAPEIIAFHYSQGGERIKAAQFWLEAGKLAAQSSASQEGISHFTAALVELEEAGESDERTDFELAAWVGLGPLLMATQGVGSPAVSEAYETAARLAEKAQDADQLFHSKFNTWHINNVTGNCRVARDIAQDLLTYCDAGHSGDQDEDKLLQAHHASWSTALVRGDFVECRKHLEHGAVIYDREKFSNHKFVYAGHDPGVCSHMFSSWQFTITGNVDEALRTSNDAFALSKRVDHPYSTSVAYLGAAISMRFLGLADLQQKQTAAGIELCETYGLMAWLPILKFSQATLMTRQSDQDAVAAGIENMLDCHKTWTGAGAGMFTPWFNFEIATAKLALGDIAAAQEFVERAKQCSHHNDEHWVDPDILCLEAAIQEADHIEPEAVSHLYGAAEASARLIGANLAGRKASLAHAQLLCRIGDREKAHEVLRAADTSMTRKNSS